MKLIVKIFVIVSFCIGIAFGQILKNEFQMIDFGDYIGIHSMECIDSDEDGKDEIFIMSMNGLYKLEKFNDNYIVNQCADMYINLNTNKMISCGTIIKSGNEFVCYTVLSNGLVRVYDAKNLNLIDEFTVFDTSLTPDYYGITSFNYICCAVEDLNNDGILEMIVVGSDYLKVIRLSDKSQIFFSDLYGVGSEYVGSKVLSVGNIDLDPYKEIILSTGQVINSNTFEVKYVYSSSPTRNLFLAEINGDNRLDLLFTDYYRQALSAKSFEDSLVTLWTINIPHEVMALKVFDVTGDQNPELIVGTYQQAYLRVYDLVTQNLIDEIHSSFTSCVSNLTIGDPDYDNLNEYIWSIGGCSTGPDNLIITDVITKNEEWKSKDLRGPFYLNFFNDDNNIEFWGASQQSQSHQAIGSIFSFENIYNSISFYEPNTLGIYGDYISSVYCYQLNGVENYILIGDEDHLYKINRTTLSTENILVSSQSPRGVRVVTVDDIDNDSNPEIVLLFGFNKIMAYDLNTLMYEWTIEDNRFFRIRDLSVENLGGKKIFFCAESHFQTGYSGYYNAETQTLQWLDSSMTIVTSISNIARDENSNNYLLLGDENGLLYKVNLNTLNKSILFDNGMMISELKVRNVDLETTDEIILVDDKIKIVDSQTFELKYSTNEVNASAFSNYLIIEDIDNDTLMNFIWNNSTGLFEYELTTKFLTGIKQYEVTPFSYNLSQNYPNPFNPSTKIQYEIPERSFVTIKIYDVLGNEIDVIANEERLQGKYEIEFNGTSLTSGIYFYQIQAGNFVETKKMILLK